GVLRVGNQQAAVLQHAHDAVAEGVEQLVQFFAGRAAGAVEGRAAVSLISACHQHKMQRSVKGAGYS
ncbi:MAG: hypothetical protein PVJ33_17880, partial [Lysobacterales bacterium]